MKNYFVPVATSIWTLFVVVSMVSAQVLPPPPIRAAGQAATTVKTPAQILQENNAAFALILSDGNSTVSLGSGFFIEDGSGLVTNFHVIEGAKVIYVKTGDGRTFNTDTAYAYDVKQDLAVLKVSPGVTQTAALGDSDKVVVGTPITVIGNPEGLEKSVSNGLISGIRTLDGQQLFQISAPISHGSSGGPVFDDKGEVIGVVVASLSDGQNLNFAIPINLVPKMWSARHEVSLASLPISEHAKGRSTTSASLDGSWAATFADSVSSGQLSFTLAQDGTRIRGTYTSSGGGGGTVTGQVADGRFSFELNQAVQGCPGRFTGSAELRSGSMVGTYSGSDCQGTHAKGSLTMTQGLAPIAPVQPAPVAAAASQPIIEYGAAGELRGVKSVFLFGLEPNVRINMLKAFAKHPEVRVAGRIEEADVVVVFGGQTFSRGTYTNVWTDANGNAHGRAVPLYGVTGQGSVVKLIPPNRIRVVWQFSATRVNVFQRRPSTNFVRDFIAAWEKANR
jgi:hypothetical protein